MPIAHHYYCGGFGFVIAVECIRWNPHGRVVVQKQQPPSSSSSIGNFALDGFHMCAILFVLPCVYMFFLCNPRMIIRSFPTYEILYMFLQTPSVSNKKKRLDINCVTK